MPKISILTPVYIDIPEKLNWFDEMLNSVLAQTFQDWEAIIIDDYSIFDPGELKWKFQNEKRFRWFKTATNSGPAAVRNTAAALAESEALLPLDSDDMLANEDALTNLYNVWQEDKAKTVFGNLQLYSSSENQLNKPFERGKVFELADYSFENAMNLNGVMPVTVMHSIQAHQAAGGWKAELDAGREDVEYWIACGKAGFCGKRINDTILLYRRHNESRDWRLKNANMRIAEMEKAIVAMHSDIFEGRFPVGCCGGSNNKAASVAVNNAAQVASTQSTRITPLEGFDEKDLVWVEYRGPRKASFNIARGKSTYRILGTGHKLQVHRDDLEIFKIMERGQAFLPGINDPRKEIAPEPQPTISEHKFQPTQPQLATIERVDEIAAENRSFETPLPEPDNSSQISIADLDLGIFETVLHEDGWTVEKLANAKVGDLTKYTGIGLVRATQIIEKARELLK